MFEHFLIAAAAHITVDVTKEGLKKAFEYVSKNRPDLAKSATDAEKSGDFKAIEEILKQALGVINLAASNGEIKIDGGSLQALNSIQFDHQNGSVSIAGAVISSRVLVIGGSGSANGITTIGINTSLKSLGTSVEIGNGCSITMTGGACMVQS